MKLPCYKYLSELKGKRSDGAVITAGAVNVHRNPKFYKYYWWVFTLDSPVDGAEFLTDRYRLNHAAYERKINEIRNMNGFAMVYNEKLYRIGVGSMWDELKLRTLQPNVRFAVDYASDADEISDSGYK